MSEKLNQQLEQQDLEAMADQLLAEDAAKREKEDSKSRKKLDDKTIAALPAATLITANEKLKDLLIDAPLVKYRKHDSNLSGKFTDGRDKIERMRFRLGYAHLQQLADLQKYLEKHPEQYRRIARLRRRVSDNYIVSQFCSAFRFCPSCRLHLVIEALTSPRYWRIAAERIWKRLWR